MPRFLTCWLLLALAWPSIPSAEPLDRQWRFTVLLNGKPIGHHHVDLAKRGDDVEYQSETRLDVKILFINVYSYLHTDAESWRDDCLTKIESSTNDNGKREFVRGARAAASFKIETPKGASELAAPCIMTFAYWNPRILTATRLMNAQTGAEVPVRITALGKDTVLANGAEIAAEHYAIVGEKLNIELWYAQGEWVALATTTERGERLQYQLRER